MYFILPTWCEESLLYLNIVWWVSVVNYWQRPTHMLYLLYVLAQVSFTFVGYQEIINFLKTSISFLYCMMNLRK